MRLVGLPPCLAAAFLIAVFDPARLPVTLTAVVLAFDAVLVAGLAAFFAAFLAGALALAGVLDLAGALAFA